MTLKIFWHYLKRAATEPLTLVIFLLLPVAVITFQVIIMDSVTEGYYHIVQGYDVQSTGFIIIIMLLFQIMCGTYTSDFVFWDFKSDRRWRLLATPISLNKYLFSAVAAGMLATLVSGFIILAVGYFAFNMYLGNIGMILAVMLVIALFSHLLGLFLSLFCKKRGTVDALIQLIAWGMIILSGYFLISIDLPLVGDFFSTYGTPYVAAISAIFESMSVYEPEIGEAIIIRGDMSQAFLYFGILAGMTAVMAVATIIAVRRRPL